MTPCVTSGSSTDQILDGCKIVEDGDVVFVSMNYRVGIFGFLALPELRDGQLWRTVGNWGLLVRRGCRSSRGSRNARGAYR